MKKLNLLVLITVISVIIAGCAHSDNKQKKQALIDLSSINSITIQNDSGAVIILTDHKLMKSFDEAVHSAEYDSSKLDIAEPDYVATVEAEDKEGEKFSFWIKGENDGLFIKSGQNGHYRLPGTEKAALLQLFQSDNQQIEPNKLRVDEDIKQITLAKSLAHGSVNPNITVDFVDNETIEPIVRAIHTAEQMPGILNTTTPNYDIVLTSDNEKYAFHLWINETSEQAMLMDVKETNTGYKVTMEATAELKKIVIPDASFKGLEFTASRNASGDLVAKPIGLSENNYMINGGPVVELQGISYHTIHFFYGDHNAINALVAHDPSTDEAGQYHLSSYNVVTGNVERLRDNFWPITDDYDYIYLVEWNDDKQQLFMQSYLGNVWIFDLKTGEDVIHLQKYRVIPHSTTGAPSLFLSPTFERFVFDDESGQLTFYNKKGVPLEYIPLPSERYVPSEKIKWNPAGTIAWMDVAEDDQNRILDIDIDYLKIAPQEIHFYNQDGLPIGSILAENEHEGGALEVAGWMDANVAVMKSYTVEQKNKDRIGLNVEDVSYFLYDVRKMKKDNTSMSIPPSALLTSDQQKDASRGQGNIIVVFNEITYKAGLRDR